MVVKRNLIERKSHCAAAFAREAVCDFRCKDIEESRTEGVVAQCFEPKPDVIGFVPSHFAKGGERNRFQSDLPRVGDSSLDQPPPKPSALRAGMDRYFPDVEVLGEMLGTQEGGEVSIRPLSHPTQARRDQPLMRLNRHNPIIRDPRKVWDGAKQRTR